MEQAYHLYKIVANKSKEKGSKLLQEQWLDYIKNKEKQPQIYVVFWYDYKEPSTTGPMDAFVANNDYSALYHYLTTSAQKYNTTFLDQLGINTIDDVMDESVEVLIERLTVEYFVLPAPYREPNDYIMGTQLYKFKYQ